MKKLVFVLLMVAGGLVGSIAQSTPGESCWNDFGCDVGERCHIPGGTGIGEGMCIKK